MKTKERPIPPNQATVEGEKVKIRSYNARENKYNNEIEADCDQILENLRATKIRFLIKNIAGPQIYEDEGEGSSDEEKGKKKGMEKDELLLFAEKNEHKIESQANDLDMIDIRMQDEEEIEIKEKGPSRFGGVKGPKNKLTQIPKPT